MVFALGSTTIYAQTPSKKSEVKKENCCGNKQQCPMEQTAKCPKDKKSECSKEQKAKCSKEQKNNCPKKSEAKADMKKTTCCSKK